MIVFALLKLSSAFIMLVGWALGSAMNRRYPVSLRACHVSGYYQDSGYSVSLPAWLYFGITEAKKAS